ncbi:MAG: ABC transporter substrate-binding protein [Xanthobacteraceae bacterium]|jgi:putative tryptophan/tyrosine transport system substrate-binding protein
MKRRAFILALGGAAAWPLTARAQQPAMPVIGILHSQTQESEAARMPAIEQGLSEVGFFAGRNVTIAHRFADGHNDRLPMLAAELVRLQVNVIFANTTPPALAAKTATARIPIVFVTGVDPVEVGLVASLNRPGANVTGVTFLSNKLVAKRLALLCDVAPGNAPIGMLAAQHNPNTETDVRDAFSAATALGRTLHVVKVAPQGDIDAAIAALVRQQVGALFVAPQADFRMWRQQLLALAAHHALPTSFSSSDHVTAGGLMSYGPDQMDSYREAGIYAGRILKGESPAGLPVMLATKFEFAINLKTATALGLAMPAPLLALATKVVE